MKILLIYLIIFCNLFYIYSQRFNNSYTSPLGIPLLVAGNFGELRPNHFHMGMDFKTLGKTGLELHSIDDGYVSRVKVSTYGYGKVVYINHYDGRTSVYAHCSKFVGALDSVVKSEQKVAENFEIELFFYPEQIHLNKGEIFALSGNTGSSTAPHLHFEIRDTKTEKVLNPLIYGFDLADSKAPKIRRVRAFSVNEQGYIAPINAIEKAILKTKYGYSISNDTLKIPSNFCSSYGGVGLAFDIIDFMDGSDNTCGLYGTFLIVDGDTIFGQKTDEISFYKTRYINSHRDLSSYGHVHKSFKNCSNPLEIYINNNLGVINLEPGEARNVHFVAYDAKNNKSEVNFVICAVNGKTSKNYNPSIDKYWYPEEPFIYKSDTWEVFADSFSIYEPTLYINNDIPHIFDASTKLQKYVTIKMKLINPKYSFEKYYISVTGKYGSKSLKTSYLDNWLTAKTIDAGNFSIQTDISPPVIKPLTTSYSIKTKIIKFYISDSQTALNDYDLFIDDKWYLLEYEHKGKIAFFEVPSDLKGLHSVKIIAKDECSNISVWERNMLFN